MEIGTRNCGSLAGIAVVAPRVSETPATRDPCTKESLPAALRDPLEWLLEGPFAAGELLGVEAPLAASGCLGLAVGIAAAL
jgi:hypothetical protein